MTARFPKRQIETLTTPNEGKAMARELDHIGAAVTDRSGSVRDDALAAALREIEAICTESAGDCRRRMGTRVGNCLTTARAALKAAGAA